MEEPDKLKEIQKLVADKKVVFATDKGVRDVLLAPFVQKVLIVIAPNPKRVWISDESTIGDFLVRFDKKERPTVLADWQKKLQPDLAPRDYIVDVAKKLMESMK